MEALASRHGGRVNAGRLVSPLSKLMPLYVHGISTGHRETVIAEPARVILMRNRQWHSICAQPILYVWINHTLMDKLHRSKLIPSPYPRYPSLHGLDSVLRYPLEERNYVWHVSLEGGKMGGQTPHLGAQ